MFTTPILLIIFNRPRETEKVFEAIRKIKPLELFIAADGPRKGNESDLGECAQVRRIVDAIDWPCRVETLFQKENLGCGLGVATAINWFFERVKQGIILEDDCVPDQSFFRFCQELLTYYRDNTKVMHISGNNFQYGKRRGRASYYFSSYTHNWGWATWRRAWKVYDFNCVPEEMRQSNWDYQWMMSVRKHKGLAVLPNINLVSNIGFSNDATHTKEYSHYSNLPTRSIEFPLIHPKIIIRNWQADFFTYRDLFGGTVGKFLYAKISATTPRFVKVLIKSLLK